MHKKNWLLVCNGAAAKKEFLKAAAKNAFVICADGGANTAAKAGIIPDIIIGDMDSVSPGVKNKFSKYPKVSWIKINRQDNTDLEKALDYIKEQKIKEVTMLCATGGRLDFTLGNLMSVFKYLKDINITIKGENWLIRPIIKTTAFSCEKDSRMSIIPTTKCTGVTLHGLKYPLKNVTLETWQPQLSNETLKKSFKIELKKGNMLVYLENNK